MSDRLAPIDSYLDERGRLKAWPSKRNRQIAALHYLAAKFDPEITYTERQLNEVLKQWHTFEDWALLRRDMVDLGLFERDDDGRSYRLVEEAMIEPDAG